MDTAAIRIFLLWCTILNAGLLLFTFFLFVFARDWLYRMHGRWFTLRREAFDTVIYSFLGLYKLLVLVFNVIPLLALLIMG